MEKKTIDVNAVIDSAKFFPVPFGIAIMMILIMLSDGFDLFIMGYVGPALVEDWGISRADIQPVNTAGLIGMAIGSVGLGWLGDRIGRKTAYVSCLVLLCLGSLGCYFSANVTQLFIWRLIMGFGLGGVTPLATTLVSEWTSKRIRSVVVACVIVAVPLGGTLAGFVNEIVVSEPADWRNMFLVGAIVPLALFCVFVFTLPESPKYMAKHEHLHAKLAKSLNRLLREKRFEGNENFVVHEETQHTGNWFVTIWNKHFAKRTGLIWTAFAVNSFVLYMFTNQLPLLLDTAGQPAELQSRSLQLFSFGAFIGSIGGAYLIGAFGSRYVGTTLAALGAVATVVMALLLQVDTVSAFLLLSACLIGGASVNGMQAFMYAVSAHSYPTQIRGSAIGMAQTFSRIGAVLSPIVAGIYFAMEPLPSVSAFLFFMAAVIMLTVTSFFLIPSHIPKNEKPDVPVEDPKVGGEGSVQ